MRSLLQRLRFALKHRTLKKAAILSENPEMIEVCHGGTLTRLKRRCPHQGAPMETGSVQDGHLVCPWHGCRFRLGSGQKG